jgi:hypothetical protein
MLSLCVVLICLCGVFAWVSISPCTDCAPDGQYRQDFAQVVALVEAERIQPDEQGWAILPEEYHHLSDSGQIGIYLTDGVISVFFWRSRSILGEGTGYVYRSDNNPPDSIIWCDEWERIDIDKWFTCFSY